MHCFVCRLLYFSNFELARILPWYTNSSSSNLFLISSCKIDLINQFYSYIYCIVFCFHCQLNFVLQDYIMRADRSAFLLSVKQPYKKLGCVWWGELLRFLFFGDREGQGIYLCDLSRAVLELSRTAVVELAVPTTWLCHVRQSLVVCTLVSQWVQETIC